MVRQDTRRAAERSGKTEKRGKTRSSRSLAVSEVLRHDVQSGRYGPGDRITEEKVAARLGVSRTPVREALRRLESEGLVVSLPWRGVVVAELDHGQVLELYAMREVLEGTAARFAAQHADDAEIDVMRDILQRQAEGGDDSDLAARINRDLHETIYSAARNRYLLSTLHGLRNALALLKGTTFSAPGRPKSALGEHRAIVDAIAKRDGDKAEQAARRHIANARRTRLKMLYTPPDT